MKTVGFGYFHRKKNKTASYRIICLTKVFQRVFTVCLFLLLILVINLLNTGIIADVKTSLSQFLEHMAMSSLYFGL